MYSYIKMLNVRKMSLIVAAMAMLLFSSLLYGCAAPSAVASGEPAQAVTPLDVTASPSAPLFDESITTTLYERCIPAVVQIESVIEIGSRLPAPFGFGLPRQQGLGSGFFIDDQGHILTNNHVVDRASKVKVVLEDGTSLEARVIGTDRHNDLALLQIDTAQAGGIRYLMLGDSSTVKPGQMSVALGSPFGLQGSITVGIVSGIGRSIPGTDERAMTNIIQTDAAINPGNSGGPLLNSKGEVIGINTAIESAANGVGFAVPVNTAKRLLPELLKGGEVKTAWLGIEGTPVNRELADELNLKTEKGVYIVGVLKDGPAEKAGLIQSGRDSSGEPTAGGDVITALDDIQVASVQDMLSYLNNKRPGDRITLSVLRGGQQITVPVELGEWPDNLSSRLIIDPNYGQGQGEDEGNGFDFGPFHFRIR